MQALLCTQLRRARLVLSSLSGLTNVEQAMFHHLRCAGVLHLVCKAETYSLGFGLGTDKWG